MAFRFKDKERPASYVCRCASALHVRCVLRVTRSVLIQFVGLFARDARCGQVHEKRTFLETVVDK